MKLSRRRTLFLLGIGVTGLSLPIVIDLPLLNQRAFFDKSTIQELSSRLPYVPEVADAMKKLHPEVPLESFQSVLNSLYSQSRASLTAEQTLEIVKEKIRSDFRSGNVIDVAGWKLSETEVRIFCSQRDSEYL